MNKLKLKTNEKGYCDEVILNNQSIGKHITKLELIIEAGEKPKLVITTYSNNIDIECEDVEVIKKVS